jgi:adenylate cyclase
MTTTLAPESPAASHIEQAQLAPPRRRTGYVLVVDDEEPNRTLLRDPLEACGYEVAEAENGLQALQLINTRQPDVILLDVMMPKMNGFELCQRLKIDRGTAAIPVLMVTALSDRRERLLGVEAGANDFLNKPVDIQDVTLRVANAVYTKQLHEELRVAQANAERLLLNILPKSIAERMKQGEVSIADYHPDVSVLVADLAGFTTLSALTGSEQVVCLLNEMFSAFDGLVEKRGFEKIKTIGDAYMAAGGIANPRLNHAVAAAELALDMQEEVKRFNEVYDTSLRFRIGVSTGPLTAGVIGRRKFAYDIWGETVNTACHLQSLSRPGCIQVAERTFERLQDQYRFDDRQVQPAKGLSDLVAYRLLGRH